MSGDGCYSTAIGSPPSHQLSELVDLYDSATIRVRHFDVAIGVVAAPPFWMSKWTSRVPNAASRVCWCLPVEHGNVTVTFAWFCYQWRRYPRGGSMARRSSRSSSAMVWSLQHSWRSAPAQASCEIVVQTGFPALSRNSRSFQSSPSTAGRTRLIRPFWRHRTAAASSPARSAS